MKKVDLHIHTISTFSDSGFEFSLNTLSKYVEKAAIDAIAITNHDTFDAEQFNEIVSSLSIKVFPGIEINLENGHVLIISDEKDVDGFSEKCDEVASKITKVGDSITVEQLESIFSDLSKYLVIPHYDKKPAIKGETFKKLEKYISAGEVNSPKKFIRIVKGASKITPVLFSDVRIHSEIANFPTRQTYIDCGELTISSLKSSLLDKGKVALSEKDGNDLFQIFDDGQKLSTGLNILLGGRSTGKTYTLNKINQVNKRTKYIKQFSLVQQDEDVYARKFNEDVANKESIFVDDYLKQYKTVLHECLNIDLINNNKKIDKYIETLLQSAEEVEKKDLFSKTTLFNETVFKTGDDKVLGDLIKSVRQVIENIEYRTTIEKHVNIQSLKNLAIELIDMLWEKAYKKKKEVEVNIIIKDIQEKLRRRTSATHVEDVDLYKCNIEKKAIEKFESITKNLQKEGIISEEKVQNFKVVANKRPFKGAGEIKKVSKRNCAFSKAYEEYENPYQYLLTLQENDSLTESEFYKYFVKIDYEILNKDGYKVSGGERSEFRLLQEITDAQNYDILLIDEPESSFDNIFLKGEVNQVIKQLSEIMPVVVVTHNSTVGASIKADYIIFTSKELEGKNIIYRLYSGHPADKELVSLDGKKEKNFDVMMNSLEAGVSTYEERRQEYETIKD